MSATEKESSSLYSSAVEELVAIGAAIAVQDNNRSQHNIIGR